MDQVDKVRKLEEKILPKEWDYTQIKGISLEAQQKLNKSALTPSAKQAVSLAYPQRMCLYC